MKISIKAKLIISYTLLSLFLVGSLLLISNYYVKKNFKEYIIHLQENKNSNIVNMVSERFGTDGAVPDADYLKSVGDTALSEGLILMVYDSDGNRIFCMSDTYKQICDSMIENMSQHMSSIYPDFNGQYEEKTYDIIQSDMELGKVTLGYYGPFYYNNHDVQFLHVLNKMLLIAGCVFLLIAALLGIFMADRISKPVKSVISQTKRIEEGNYSDRLELRSGTYEINQLISSINGLADSLKMQQILKKRMAGDYAHELRTPLTTLQVNLEAMIDGIWEPDQEKLEGCLEEILRLTRMLSDIDHLVKIENDTVILKKSRFVLADTVRQVMINFEPLLAAKNIYFYEQLEECEIYADRDKIKQLVINLISNAYKYTNEGGHIKINIFTDRTNVILTVQDNGIGIAKEDLPNIFEHLYRVDKSRDRNTGGSGIGLSVVKAITEAHGGKIETQSELGVGSQFTVILPRLIS